MVSELSLPKLGLFPGGESLPDVEFSILEDLAIRERRYLQSSKESETLISF